MWWLRDRFDRASLPAGRTVVQVNLAAPDRRYWLLLQPESIDVCRTDPGYEVDLTLTAPTAELFRVVQGWQPLDRALRDGLLTLVGPSGVTRDFARWFSSPFAVVG